MQKTGVQESGLVKFLRFGVYLTAFTPLIIWKDFISPFHFGKVMIFRSLIEILGAGYLILILKDQMYLPRRDKIFWAFFLFTAAFTLTTLTSVLRFPSFWGSLERMGGLWTFWHYFLFFIILTSLMTKREHWQKLLNFTIFTGVLSAFYGFFQKTNLDFFLGSGGRERIFGSIGNAALFAGFELISVFLALTLAFHPQTLPKRRKWYLLAFGIMSVAVLMTAVRGSLLGFAVGLAVFAFLWMKHSGSEQKARWGKRVFAALIGLAVFWGIFSLLFHNSSFVNGSRYLKRVTNLSLTAVTVKTRAWAWQAGLKGWSEGPKTILLGWGPENFNIPFSKYFNPKFYAGSGSETLFDRAHNMFIEILVTMGLAGLLAYLGIFSAVFSSLRKLLKNQDYGFYAMGLIPLVITYIIHNSFIFDTNPNLVVFFTMLGFVSFMRFSAQGQGQASQGSTRVFKPNQTLTNFMTAILIIFIPFIIYKTNVLPAKANYTLTRAIVRGWNGDVAGAFAKYRESLAYDAPGKYEYRHRLAQYLVGPGAPSVREKAVRDMHLFALEEIDKNIKENPVDYLPYLYGSRLSIMLGKDDYQSVYNNRALDYSMKALELSPTFIRTYFEIAQAYLNKNDFPKAIDYFRQAVALNPDTGISYWYLGSARVQSGDLGGVEDLERATTAKNKHALTEPDYLRLINSYLEIKNFARVAELYEKIIKKNPDNPQHFASLATAYAKLGRIDDAVKASRQAVKIDPSFESDARIFLKSLGREL